MMKNLLLIALVLNVGACAPLEATLDSGAPADSGNLHDGGTPNDGGAPDDGGLPGDSGTAAPHFFSTVSDWLVSTQTFVQGWDALHHRVAIIKKDASSGIFNGYWASETGSTLSCLTCTLPNATPTQRGIGDVFPSGDYVVLTVEKDVHPGKIGDSSSEPGKGVYNDIWIAKSDGTQAWQVTNQPVDSSHGIIWPRLNAQGTQLVWAEMYQGLDVFSPKKLLGSWRLKLADIVWSVGVPSLANVKAYEPEVGNFYEPYGFSPDGTQILFASSAFMPGVGDSQIYRVSTSLTGLTRLSDQNEINSGGWSNYNEFAFYTADGAHIIYGRIKQSTAGGIDYWIMNADGSHQERLTYMNEPWSPQSSGYTNMGGWAIDPSDPNHILAGACSDTVCETGKIVSLHLASIGGGSGTGLVADYFSDRQLTTKVMGRTDPYVGFNWGSSSPGPNLPADGFAVRWTGSLQPYTTGPHQLCTFDDDGARVWVDDVLVIDAWYDQGPTAHCSPLSLDASRRHPIKIEFYDSFGSATMKLSWQVPGMSGNSQEVIPTGQLFP
jgi:hypothetical protein